jgi:CBS domain-containing protein
MSVEQPAAEQKRVSETPADKTDSPQRVRQISVKQLHTDNYVCIEPSTPLHQAIERMKEDDGGCAIVCEANRIVGIFTERDLITKIIGEGVDMNAPVSQWMTGVVETLASDATLGDVVELMNRKGIRNVPLVTDGQLSGSISVFDVITYLAESYPKETMNLPPVPAQVMDTQEGG